MKKLNYVHGILIICLLIGPLCAADMPLPPSIYQIRWSRIADYPVRLSEVSAIASGDRIYVMGGKITNDNQDMSDNRDVDYNYEYDPATNIWTQRASMPTPHYDVALVSLNGKIYAINSKNESYDPASDTWQRHAPLPHGGAHSNGAAAGDEIFMFGAEGPNLCSQTMAFNPKSNTWRSCAPIPTPRWLSSVAVAFDGRIYLMGGIGYNARGRLGPVHREVEAYDPVTNRWEQRPLLPQGVFGALGAGVFDGKMFLIGANKGERLAESRDSGENYVFDPGTDTWSRITDLPHNHGGAAVAFDKGRIYLIGGHDEGFKQYSDAYVGVIQTDITFEGRLYSSNKRAVVLPYPGRITEVLVQKNDRVEQGTPLLRYRLVQSAINDILQNLPDSPRPEDISSLLNAKYEDIKQMMETAMPVNPTMSKSTLEGRSRFIEQTATDAIATLREQFPKDFTASNLSGVFTLTSPIDATVIYMEDTLLPDATLQPSMAFVMGVSDPMITVIRLTEPEAHRIFLGNTAHISVSTLPEKTFTATVTRISKMQTSPENGQPAQYEVELSVPNPDHDIKDGNKAQGIFKFFGDMK